VALHIYTRKQRWKFFFLVIAILIGVISVWFTNNLVKKLSEEERKKMEIWAEALRGIDDALITDVSLEDKDQVIYENTMNAYNRLFYEITSKNTTIPSIYVNEKHDIIGVRNLRRLPVEEGIQLQYDVLSDKLKSYLKKQLQIMGERNDPIEIQFSTEKRYLYYKNSFLITQLLWFPFFQLAGVFLFILVSYLAINSSNIAEQNQVWVGMSKETAHQLGTPISSLLAWVELLKGSKHNLVPEIAKDVQRLEKIAERFSKIGSAPILSSESIIDVLENSIEYLKSRSSDKINFVLDYPSDQELFVPVNVSLFEWVIENLCKNSIDAMDGKGDISIRLTDHNQVLFLDIEDSGKGIAKSQFKAIFQPGFTTKQRGWGLGLSLSNRIIENYHAGKIFVKRSVLNKGTTFRIVLKK